MKSDEAKRIHDVYSFLLRSLDLTKEHRDQLNGRGFSDQEIDGNLYRSLPLRRGEVIATCFAEFGSGLSGVPGFWRDDKGGWQLSGKSGILVPVRSSDGLISALKVRVDKPSSPSSKYLLLSSNPKADKKTGEVKYPNGTAAKIAVHYPLGCPKQIEVLRVTEGEIKADIATSLLPEYTISLPGITMWRMAIDLARLHKPDLILLAFDSDKDRPTNTEGSDDSSYHEKETKGDFSTSIPEEDYAVGKALASLYLALREAGFAVAIEDWPPEAGKGIDDVLMGGCGDQIRQLSGEEADAFAKELLSADLPQDWIFVVGVKRFYNTRTLLELDKEQFADRYCHEEKGNPALRALKNPAFPKVDLPIYTPAAPTLIERAGVRYFNTWRANPVHPAPGDVSTFLEHVAYILPQPEERAILLDWMAYMVQCPGEKVLWSILLQGVEGTGKSYFGAVMRMMLGAHNVSSPTNEQLHEPYTAWQKSCQLVIIEEVMARGRLELMNKLKPMITQETTTIREMFKPAYEQPNVFNLLLLTNHKDAIILDKTDRRYCVLFSPAVARPHEYYEALWGWTIRSAPYLLAYFQTRDISAFRPKAHAPMTGGKGELITMSLPPLQAWMMETIEGEAWPFMGDLVSTSHLSECLPKSLWGSSLQAVGKALKAAGAVELGQVSLSSGAKARLWSVRRHEIWAGAEKPTLAAEYEKWANTAQPGGNPLLDAKPM